jgi:outer membrane protein OmpA-like peptidoglycan-associated protein
MATINHIPSRILPGKAAWMVMGVVLSTSFLGACSRVPDAVNPAEWYRGTVDFFAGEEDAKAAKGGKESSLVADRGKAPPGSDQAFPNLASVDKQARARDSAGGLTADTERPKYAPAIQRQGTASSTLRDRPRPAPTPRPVPAAPKVSATQPQPPAMPKPRVAPVPMQPPGQPEMAKPAPTPKITAPEMTADQQATQTRLARQLAEIRARAASTRSAPMVTNDPAGGDELATLVISSQGIISEGTVAAAVEASSAPVAPPPGSGSTSQLTVDQSSAPATGDSIRVATILFANGSSRLKAADKKILGAVVRLQRKRGGRIQVVGHASSRTRNLAPVKHKMANFKISVDRADSVADALMRLGLSNKDILIAAVSDIDPAYYEFMPSGEAGNRRAEVYLSR